jgi:hypothetical protein
VNKLAPALLAIPLLAAVGCGAAGDAVPREVVAFDQAALERQEDHSESLANDLLKFSVAVRDRAYERVAEFVADSIHATPLPPPAAEPVRAARWVDKRSYAPAAAVTSERHEFLDGLRTYLDPWTRIEDARFKVVAAEFEDGPPPHADAKIKFFIVGRDERGRRHWLRGKAHIEATRPDDGPWRLAAFEIDPLEASTATDELFSEIAFPAGMAAFYPRFGEGRNEGFVAHGAAAADVDGDGLLDLAASGVEQNYLYLSSGDGTFRDVSESSLVAAAPIGSGALFLDFDDDGDPDLFLAAVGKQILLENRFVPDREVRFWDVSEQAGVDRPAIGFSAVAADADGDGRTDVYVCSYNRYGKVMPNSWYEATNGTPNLLFLNRGDGTFREAAAEWGVADDRWTYAAGFIDIDGDADQDLYVANDFGENALYINLGDRFVDAAERYGVVDAGFGMGVSFGDYDNDGDFDLHVTNMSSTAGQRILKLLYPPEHEIFQTLFRQALGNSLYANAGNGTFRNVTEEVGGLPGGWAFGGGFIDFDNDGWQDLYTPNGFVSGKTMDDT